MNQTAIESKLQHAAIQNTTTLPVKLRKVGADKLNSIRDNEEIRRTARSDPSWEVRFVAVEKLGKNGDGDVLLDVALDDPDIFVRFAAAKQLGDDYWYMPDRSDGISPSERNTELRHLYNFGEVGDVPFGDFLTPEEEIDEAEALGPYPLIPYTQLVTLYRKSD